MDTFVELKAVISDFQAKMALARGEMDKVQAHGASKFSALGQASGLALGGVAAAGIGIAAASVKMAGDFQQNMSKLVTSGGETAANLKGDMSGVIALMGQTGTSSQQLAAGLYMINSAGFHGAAGLQILKAAAQGAKTENADLGEVTDGLTTLMNDYHISASGAALVTSKMVEATSLGKTTFQDLAGSLHTVAPAADAAGVSMNEVLGAMATMTAKGTPAADAATYLRQTILQLANPTQKARNEMSALGLSFIDVSKNLGERGLTGTLDLLTTAIQSKMGPAGTVLIDNLKQAAAAGSTWASSLQKMPPAQQAQIQSLADMGVAADKVKTELAAGGKETAAQKELLASYQAKLAGMPATYRSVLDGLIANKLGYKDLNSTIAELPPEQQTVIGALADMVGGTKSMQAALELTGASASTFQTNVQKVGKATTEAGGNVAGWATVQNNFNQKVSEAKGTLEGLGIQLGLKLIPVIEATAKKVSELVTWFDHHKAAAIALATVITSVLAVAFAAFTVNKVSALISSVQKATTTLGLMGTKATATAGEVDGLNASSAGVTSGIGSKMTGAFAVAGAGMAAFSLTTQLLKSNFLGLGGAVNSAASSVVNFLGIQVGPSPTQKGLTSSTTSWLESVASGQVVDSKISAGDARSELHTMGVPGYDKGGWVNRTGIIFAHAGEYVLNPQQAQAASSAPSGGGGDLVIQIDNRELARVVGPEFRAWMARNPDRNGVRGHLTS